MTWDGKVDGPLRVEVRKEGETAKCLADDRFGRGPVHIVARRYEFVVGVA